MFIPDPVLGSLEVFDLVPLVLVVVIVLKLIVAVAICEVAVVTLDCVRLLLSAATSFLPPAFIAYAFSKRNNYIRFYIHLISNFFCSVCNILCLLQEILNIFNRSSFERLVGRLATGWRWGSIGTPEPLSR